MSDDGLMSGRELPLGLIRRAHTAAYFYLSFLAIYELIWLPLHVHRVSFHFLFFLFYFYFYFIFIFIFVFICFFFLIYFILFIYFFFFFSFTLLYVLIYCFPYPIRISLSHLPSPFSLFSDINIVYERKTFIFTSMGLLAAEKGNGEKRKCKRLKRIHFKKKKKD